MTLLTVYGGVDVIGGNKILLEADNISRVRMRELARDDQTIRESIEPRVYTRMATLHGDCFYMGICEPMDEVERRIKETDELIEDARKLAGL